MRTRTPFVVLTSPRSGSNWLITLLNQHPHMRCSFEVLHNETDQRTPMVPAIPHETVPERGRRYDDTQEGSDFLRELYEVRYSSRVRAIGFKLFYDQAAGGRARSAWSYLAKRPDVRVVHLTRENLLASFVSLQRALRTDVWMRSARDESREDPVSAEVVDPDAFEAYVETMRVDRANALDRLGAHPTLPLTFEQLRARRGHHVSRVFRFLGIRAWPWVWTFKDRTVPQARRPLAQRIANHEQLVRRFAGTPLERYFTGHT